MGVVRLVRISLKHWREWNAQYRCLPYIHEIVVDACAFDRWTSIQAHMTKAGAILESGKMGRFTFVGVNPVEWLSGSLEQGTLTSFERQGKPVIWQGSPLTLLKRWMSAYRAPQVEGVPKMTGGIIGYIGYDVARTIERLPAMAAADLPVADYSFLRFEQLWVVDQQGRKVYCCVHAVNRQDVPWTEAELEERYNHSAMTAEKLAAQWAHWVKEAAPGSAVTETAGDFASFSKVDIDVERIPDLRMSLDKERFQSAVCKIQQYIAAGDVFQVNLSIRQQKVLEASPEQVYETLRRLNPSPYMGYLQFPDGSRIVSASPELLVKLEGRRLSTRPIAGTRRRGNDEGEDGALQEELLLNEKERAEHVMLVDLERNDLGRIAVYGSVRVSEFMAVERYSHVMHIVSEVEGELAEGYDAFDTIAAVFPGGTITGAPKIRTMEIIEELEPVRRGPYTGSIGWIDYNGNMELNITIRTLVFADGTATVQSGAGIVIDSDPEKEFYESLNKAKALWKAVELSERAAREEKSGVEKEAMP